MTDWFIENGGCIHPAVQYWNGGLWVWNDIFPGEVLIETPGKLCLWSDTSTGLASKIYDEMERDDTSYWNNCEAPCIDELKFWLSKFKNVLEETKSDKERSVKAVYLRQTRAWDSSNFHVAVPMIDRANHIPISLNNATVVIPPTKGMSVKLVATKKISSGHPIHITYWTNQDVCLKAFQYNFFDSSHGNHAITTNITLTVNTPKDDDDLVKMVIDDFKGTCTEDDKTGKTTLNINPFIIIDEYGNIPELSKRLCSKLNSNPNTDWHSPFCVIIKSSLTSESDKSELPPHILQAFEWRTKRLQSIYRQTIRKVLNKT